MKCVIQRVKEAGVSINGKPYSKIGKGLLVLCAFSNDDTERSLSLALDKILNLRIFSDELGKLNLSVLDISGEVLVVSNFTVYGNTSSSGRRPDFSQSAKSEASKPLYDFFVKKCSEIVNTQSGIFGADMEINLINDGPVTLVLEK